MKSNLSKVNQAVVYMLTYWFLIQYSYAQDSDAENNSPVEITIPYCDKNNDCKSTTSTRLPVSVNKSPQKIELVTKELTSDNSSLRLEDISYYNPGITQGVTQSGFNTSLIIRGFDTEGRIFLNGQLDNQQFFIRDFSTIDHIEILKGHSSVLYGIGSPGGTVNYQTKRPLAIDKSSAGVSFGNRSLKRVIIDTTGPVDKDNSLKYRLTAAGQNADHFYDNASNDQWIVAPSIQWDYSNFGRLRFEFEAAHINTPFLFGTVRANNEILFDQSYIDPRAKSDRNFYHTRLYWDHSLNSNWSLHSSVNSLKTRRDDRLIGFLFKIDESKLRGFYRDIDDRYTQHNLRAEVRGNNLGNKIKHNPLIGVEQNTDRSSIKSNSITDFELDILNPVFDTDFSTLESLKRQYRLTNDELGLYALDKISVNQQFDLYLGARYSSYKTDFFEGLNSNHHKQRNFSKSLGVNYKWNNDLFFYGNISESFEPNIGRDRNDNFFDSKAATQFELGFRKQLFNNKLNIDAAVFNTKQDNILTSDPIDPDFKVLAGEQRHRGIEISATVFPVDNLELKAGYAYLDSEITKNNDGLAGNTPPNSPKHSGYVYINYFPKFNNNLKLNLGLIGVDKRQGNQANSFSVPGYGRLDFGAEYRLNEITFSLSAINVLNKDYLAASYLEDDLYQGTPRTIIGSISIDF